MASLESGAAEFFTADHHACDDAWAALEAAANDAAKAKGLWKAFDGAMRRHLAMEEEVLFPAFEEATGMRGMGPTEVMRHEHAQMRALLDDMARASDGGDVQGLLDLGDTLMMLIQQHNAKEEGMLYPMADAQLGGQWGAVASKLKAYLS